MTLAVVVTLTSIVLEASPARAQFPTSPPRYPSPAVSPYLNLLRRGTIPGVNYYGLVRPEMEMRRNLQSLQRQVTQTQSNVDMMTVAGASTGLPFTGKTASFMNTYGYFMNLSPAGGTGYGTLGSPTGMMPGAGPGIGAGPGATSRPPIRSAPQIPRR
jgi:hypothetical protein